MQFRVGTHITDIMANLEILITITVGTEAILKWIETNLNAMRLWKPRLTVS
jgi:hypothetical protein